LSPALIAVPQIAQHMQVNPLAQRATLRHARQHQVAKPLRHAVTARRVRVHHVQVPLAPQQVHVVVLPLTAVAVKS
jgi:hypothetical protein